MLYSWSMADCAHCTPFRRKMLHSCVTFHHWWSSRHTEHTSYTQEHSSTANIQIWHTAGATHLTMTPCSKLTRAMWSLFLFFCQMSFFPLCSVINWFMCPNGVSLRMALFCGALPPLLDRSWLSWPRRTLASGKGLCCSCLRRWHIGFKTLEMDRRSKGFRLMQPVGFLL